MLLREKFNYAQEICNMFLLLLTNQPLFLFHFQENININEASRCLVKHIIASESDPVQSVEPDIIKPHLNSSKIVSCSACFKS